MDIQALDSKYKRYDLTYIAIPNDSDNDNPAIGKLVGTNMPSFATHGVLRGTVVYSVWCDCACRKVAFSDSVGGQNATS